MFGSGPPAREAHGGRNRGRDTKKAIGTSRTKRRRSAKLKTCLPGPVVIWLLIYETPMTKANDVVLPSFDADTSAV